MSKAQAKSQYASGRIATGGMGGFLNPPTHPEHFWHVETDLQRRPENRGSLALSYAAADCTWLDPVVRQEARGLLRAWEPPSPDDPAVIDWRLRVLGYFRRCYRNPTGQAFHVSDMVIDRTRDPVANADDHAGVRYIRKYYPDYVPTPEEFLNAYWGTKPEPKKDGAS